MSHRTRPNTYAALCIHSTIYYAAYHPVQMHDIHVTQRTAQYSTIHTQYYMYTAQYICRIIHTRHNTYAVLQIHSTIHMPHYTYTAQYICSITNTQHNVLRCITRYRCMTYLSSSAPHNTAQYICRTIYTQHNMV